MVFQSNNEEELGRNLALLSSGLEKIFNFNPKKDTGKLVSLACYLSGFPNGYQQFKAHLGDNKTALPLTNLFSMENDIFLECNEDLDSLSGSYGKDNSIENSVDLRRVFHVFFDDMGVWQTNHASTDNNIFESAYYGFISNIFEVTALTLTTPNINIHGQPEMATSQLAETYLKNMHLSVTPGFDFNINDTGTDDCTPTNVFIQISVKKEFVALMNVLRQAPTLIGNREYVDVKVMLDDLSTETSKLIYPYINQFLLGDSRLMHSFEFSLKQGWDYTREY
jgi:hypothetical protein